MSVSSELMKHRKEIASDLERFRGILWNTFPNGNFAPIESAISELRDKDSIPQLKNKPSNQEVWGYTVDDILFKFVSPPAKSKPHPIDTIELLLCVKVRGNIKHIETLNDPLEELSLNIILTGKHDNKKVLSCYHLDRHIFEEGDGAPLDPHPLYHLQFGGNKMIDDSGESIDTGNTMFLDAPRVPHYPMDIVLAIDFIISNFFPDKWRSLNESNQEYINLVAKYQRRLIKPFLTMFNSHFYTNMPEANQHWSPSMIKPQFC